MGRWHPNNCSPTEDRQEVIAAGSSQTQGSAFGRGFGKPEEVIDVGCSAGNTGHGGGDAGLMDHMCRLAAGEMDGCPTSIDASVESHVMALAAEASRLAGGEVIQLSAFEKSAQ